MSNVGVDKYICPGTLKRVDVDSGENWCVACSKSTLWLGPVHEVTPVGVTVWGTIKGCRECQDWEWRDKGGTVRDITLLKDPSKENKNG